MIKLIYKKLSELRVHLLTFQDYQTVITILSYLYNECIIQKSTKPIDEFCEQLIFKNIDI